MQLFRRAPGRPARHASSEHDARQLVFSLTAAGQRKLKEALQLWQKAQAEFETQVGVRRAARLRRELLTLAREE